MPATVHPPWWMLNQWVAAAEKPYPHSAEVRSGPCRHSIWPHEVSASEATAGTAARVGLAASLVLEAVVINQALVHWLYGMRPSCCMRPTTIPGATPTLWAVVKGLQEIYALILGRQPCGHHPLAGHRRAAALGRSVDRSTFSSQLL